MTEPQPSPIWSNPMTQLDTHDSAAATPDPDAAPDNPTPQPDPGDAECVGPPEAMTPQKWWKDTYGGPERLRWTIFLRELGRLVLALHLLHRCEKRVQRLIRNHPCPHDQAEAHACDCCGRYDP